MPLFPRVLVGLALASVFAIAARRVGALSPSGMLGAIVVGTIASAAGWSWCAVLVAFFGSSTLLTRWRHAAKERVTRAVVEKGGARDGWQVAANGGIFTLAALGSVVAPSPWWPIAGLGALAGATADTWATEIGTATGGPPRSVFGWRTVPPGTSGAVTVAGSLASVAGAAFLGTVALVAGFPRGMVGPAIAGGVAGALVDTLAGATIQERRWCATCRTFTERAVHDCGSVTTYRAGVRGLGNDAVNLTSCIAAAAVALLFARWLP